jgi:hypothetical protein
MGTADYEKKIPAGVRQKNSERVSVLFRVNVAIADLSRSSSCKRRLRLYKKA